MIPSDSGGARMIAQFVKYELVESPIEITHGGGTNANTLSAKE